MTKTPKISVERAHELWRQINCKPYKIFNQETHKYDRFVEVEETGQVIGPFKSLQAYKKAAVDSYVQRYRVVPKP